jgi:hypothetical protein
MRQHFKKCKVSAFQNCIRTKVLPATSLYEFNLTKEQEDFYRIEPMELLHGMAKVRLPLGFWKTHPYGTHQTVQGPTWQRDSPLGNISFRHPSNKIFGVLGAYVNTCTENCHPTHWPNFASVRINIESSQWDPRLRL